MKKLKIPEKITLQYEFFPGFGKRELLHFLILAIPGAILGIIIYNILAGLQRIWVFIGMLIYVILCYPLTVKIDGYPSVISIAIKLYHYMTKQRNYMYIQKKEKIYEQKQ